MKGQENRIEFNQFINLLLIAAQQKNYLTILCTFRKDENTESLGKISDSMQEVVFKLQKLDNKHSLKMLLEVSRLDIDNEVDKKEIQQFLYNTRPFEEGDKMQIHQFIKDRKISSRNNLIKAL